MERGWTNSLVLLMCCTTLALSACRPGAGNEHEDTSAEARDTTALPVDFVSFYGRFHSDSVFQREHVVFPITSTLQDTSGQDSVIVWTRENWKFHAPVVPDDFWSVDFRMPLPDIVVEYIYARNGAFFIERRFAKSSSDWYLIYYSGMMDNF